MAKKPDGTGDGRTQAAKDAAVATAKTLQSNFETALSDNDLLAARRYLERLEMINPGSDQLFEANLVFDRKIVSTRTGPFTEVLNFILGISVLTGSAFGVATLFGIGSSRKLFVDNWQMALISIVVFAIIYWVTGLMERKFPTLNQNSQNIIFVFISILLIMLALGSIIFIEAKNQKFFLEITFIMVVCALPAATYYLFLKSRRLGILNEFISNLSRFSLYEQRNVQITTPTDKGKIPAPRKESNHERVSRIEGYMLRFEALYGKLRFSDEQKIGLPQQHALNSSSDYNLMAFAKSLVSASKNEVAKNQTNPIPHGGTGNGGIRMPQADVRIADIFQANLVIPLGLVTILCGVGWLMVVHPVWSPDTTDFRFTLDLTPVNFAFLGAYFFGAQMIYRRFVGRDLGPNAFMSFAVRIILAVIAIWVAALCMQFLNTGTTGVIDGGKAAITWSAKKIGLTNNVEQKKPSSSASLTPTKTGEANPQSEPSGSAINSTVVSNKVETPSNFQLISKNLSKHDENFEWPPSILVLAFVIGFFPQVLWQVIRSWNNSQKIFKSVIPETEQDQPLSQLDGLTIWHVARLEEEDIENVGNMATLDIVDVMLRTQIPAERMVSWVDQAILYSLLGAKRQTPKAAAQSENGQPIEKSKGSETPAEAEDVKPKSDAEPDAETPAVKTNAVAVPETIIEKLRKLGIRNATQYIANYYDPKSTIVLKEALGGDSKTNPMDAIACSIQIEANFELIRAWRGV